MTPAQLHLFAKHWLASWTGNQPIVLLSFYTENAYYQDPANTKGLEGKAELAIYFNKLLQRNPNWVWEVVELFPNKTGFTLKWKATIPVNEARLQLFGMDIVELMDDKISRNEVYFDRHDWFQLLSKPVLPQL